MMQIEFEAANLDASAALQQHAGDKLHRVERRWGDRITRVRIHINDINSKKGGIDKRCTMEARVAGINPVAVDATMLDAYDAVGKAADKLERALEHQLDSGKEKHR